MPKAMTYPKQKVLLRLETLLAAAMTRPNQQKRYMSFQIQRLSDIGQLNPSPPALWKMIKPTLEL